jgi:alpha-1,3-mannosyltransferase
LIGSILEVIEFLGKQRCAISIVEGISPDGTGDVLKALEPFLDRLGVRYYYSTSEIDSKKGNRIEKLALLRNLALEPLLDLFNSTASANTTVIFLNDVAACPEDILELTLQRQTLGADMTCGMDWFSGGDEPTFYDVWISRSINGDSFFQIPLSGSWEFALDLFWSDPETKARFEAHQPFQVYSCWNGAAVFSAAPLVEGVRFRDSAEGHCKHGEPQNFCKDLWSTGYGNIAVIPTVNLEYSNDKGLLIKELKGYVSDAIVNGEGDAEIEWTGPPAEVRCIEDWAHQFWKPWELSRRDLPDRQS